MLASEPPRARGVRPSPPAAPGPIQRWAGRRRCGTFVEVSGRAGDPHTSETLELERAARWSGLCLESDHARAEAARPLRDCTVAIDRGGEAIAAVLTRNGLSPIALDWLNLAVGAPYDLLRDGGRLDLAQVRANVVTLPLASEHERSRCLERLAAFGYEPARTPDGADESGILLRRARSDVFGFYHLYTATTWREVAAEQLRRVRDSGLADASRRVFASIVGPAVEEGAALLGEAFGARLEIVHASDEAACAERPILEFARRFCAEEEPLSRAVWYLHAKGVSSHHERNPHISDWRRLMEHFAVDRWQDCVEALCDHDACGVNWHEEPAPHFSGNFWWATPRYVASLPEAIGPEHFDPEAWIGANQPKVKCWHESGIDHYREPYPAGRYLPQAEAGGSPART